MCHYVTTRACKPKCFLCTAVPLASRSVLKMSLKQSKRSFYGCVETIHGSDNSIALFVKYSHRRCCTTYLFAIRSAVPIWVLVSLFIMLVRPIFYTYNGQVSFQSYYPPYPSGGRFLSCKNHNFTGIILIKHELKNFASYINMRMMRGRCSTWQTE